jgi:hypothetical protein
MSRSRFQIIRDQCGEIADGHLQLIAPDWIILGAEKVDLAFHTAGDQ